jgi:retinol dehydrogenase-13
MKKSSPLAFLKSAKQPILTSNEVMTNQWVLITGSTSGIGFAAAERFAQGHANLVLMGRNPDKLNQQKLDLKNRFATEVKTYVADFSSLASLNKAIQKIKDDGVILDVLINNAGVYSTKKILTRDQVELGLTVNHLASFHLTEQLQSSMKKTGGRIIQVNSEGHRFSGFPILDPNFLKRRYTGLRSYGSSKTAQLHTVWVLAPELKKQGVTLVAMHPGEVKSNIGLNNGWLYRTFKRWFIGLMLKDVHRSSDALYYLANHPTVDEYAGQYFYLTSPSEVATHAQPSAYSHDVLRWTQQTIQRILSPNS